MNYKAVFYYLGWVLLLEAVTMVIPCLIAVFSGENDVWPWFLACIAVAAVPGAFMSRKRNRTGSFYAREGYVITALSWLILSLIGAMPFFLSGRIPSFVDALFEIVSGFTTTGSTILADVEALGFGLLFWRSFSHWIGGMGVLVLILAIMPTNSAYNLQILKAESPGPSVSKLVPRVRQTAVALYLIYMGLTLAAMICYVITGMPVFDAVCIAFGTAGTGGFTVRNEGMACYSMVSQGFITFFMLLFGVNFSIYHLIIRRRFKAAFKTEDLYWYLGILFAGILIIAVSLLARQEGSVFYVLHHTVFTAVSIMTTTGFSTLDFSTWPEIAKMMLLLLMCIGACAGSTGGGMKVSRVAILLKEAVRELKCLIHPNSVQSVKFGGKPVEAGVLRSVNRYLIIYVLVFMVSVLLISLDGFDYATNFSAVAATFNNIGPGLSLVGPTAHYGSFSILSKLVLTFDMLAGRLEILPMLLLLYPGTWKKHF